MPGSSNGVTRIDGGRKKMTKAPEVARQLDRMFVWTTRYIVHYSNTNYINLLINMLSLCFFDLY